MTLGDRIVVMKDGLIQQADTPLVTYNRPTNRFVAGFIGMPPMNFFDGTIRRENGRLIFEEGQLKNAHPASGGTSHGKPSDEPLVWTGELTLPGNGFRLPVPAHLRQRLEGYVDRHVVLGIRPEHFHLRPVAAEGESAPVSVEVGVVEPLGNDMDVYMKTALHDHVVGRVEAEQGLKPNSATTVHVDVRKVHFFEPGATGMNLSLETTSPKHEPAHAVA
jgi:multiple sugar transport system ATP-binding protein